MSAEEQIKEELTAKCGLAPETVRIPRPRRIFVELAQSEFEKVFVFAKDTLKFGHLLTITGFDEGERLAFMYHLAQDSGTVLNIKFSVDKADPVIRSMIGYFAGAEIYEREVVDLFGAKVEGLPPGNRYPLTDDWPEGQYPLRKDWKCPQGGA